MCDSQMKICLLLFWISTLFLSSAEILHCALNDQLLGELCRQCQEGYILDQTRISCLLRSALTADSNCLQVSNSGECMRCTCGYAFSIQLDICVMAEDSLIGCEVLREGNICLRPKIEFLLLKGGENSSSVSLQYSHGSFCEIFDLSMGRCSRCHSGYKLDKANQCELFPHKIDNEFFSYFSADGELQSRSIQFIAWPNRGVFEKIPFCAEHEIASDILDSSILLCKECLPNKSLNKSKTTCLPQPFDLCKIVSDDDHSFCEECVDNNHFYLITDSEEFKEQRQICLPRLTNKLDPTARCLEYYLDTPFCRVCQNGLSLTHNGCSLEKSMGRDIELIDFNGFSQLKFKIRDPNCDLWIADEVCGKCKKSMIVDIHGNCQINDIEGCLILDSNGDCAQCPEYYYYEANERLCKFQTAKQYCIILSRSSNQCEKCISTYYPDQLGMCVFLTMSTCAFSQGRENKCEQCMNLSYLNDLFVCVHLTQYKNCLISDGISDTCLKCKRNFSLSTKGECVSQIIASNDVCSDSRYYLDKDTNICKEYTFQKVDYCRKFDIFNNKCLECYSGSFVKQNGDCEIILNCTLSDGIHDRCSFAISPEYYIDDQGQAQPAMENCFTNRIENNCLNCILENEQFLDYSNTGIFLNFDKYCISKDQILNKEVSHQCAHVTLVSQQIEQENITAATYRCELCRNLHFLDDNGTCTFLTDTNCMISDGSSDKCLFCYSSYRFNQTSNLCEEIPEEPIQFCEIMKRNSCIKCQSLYYTMQTQCWPISDPDCVESNGVLDRCQKCRNGLVLKPGVPEFFQKSTCFQLVHFIQEFQEIKRRNDSKIGQLGGIDNGSVVDGEKSINNNQESQSLEEQANTILLIPQYSKLATLILQVLNCEKFDENLFTCQKCKEGYHFNQKIEFLRNQCLKSVIKHCQEMNNTNVNCEQCKEGYFLFQNGQQCLEVKYCLEFKDVCMKCSEEAFLFQGQCIKLAYCKEQKNGTCLECTAGYFLQEIFTGGMENQQPKEGRNYHQTNKNQLLADVSFLRQECIRIPHCAKSDGVTELCQKCNEGFRLIQTICVRISMTQEFDFCQDFRRNNETNQLECVKCRNLYFLRGSYCISILDTNQYCQKNNGINVDCELCSFSGFKISDEGGCVQLMNCQISNGINSCVICKKHYVIGRLGICIRIQKEILNCEIYQHLMKKQDDHMNQWQSDIQSVSSSSPTTQSTLDSGSNINGSEFLRCYKCASLFYPDKETNFQHCVQLNHIEFTNCALSDGKTSTCLICYSGYLLRKNYYGQISCQPAKIAKKLSNYGCQFFNTQFECLQCYESYFLGANSNCFPRDIERKCAEFDPRKNECAVCASGYKPKKIKEHNTRETTICMRLEAREQVVDCLEYYPNTNKCSKCVKHLTQDVVEFFLNEQENLCEDVLYLMCKIISRNGKTCVQEFILNCEKYGNRRESSDNANQLSCLECRNGYYLEIADKNTICAPHSPIIHCQVYSQTLPNTCELCDLLFFLKQPDICLPISSLNCLFGDKSNDRCLKCFDRFALDIDTGNCVQAHILNCEQLQGSPMATQNVQQICKKCRQNYQFSEKHNECRLRFGYSSCQRFNLESECIECKEGFLLLSVFGNQRECVPAASSCVRSAENCLKYDVEKSNPERILCEQCKPNFVIDKNLQCSPAFESTTKKENNNLQPSARSSEGNDEKFLVEKTAFVILVGLIVSFGFVKLIVLLKKRFRNENRRLQAMQQDNNRYFEETNFEIQMAQPIQQINDQSNTTYITSLENNQKDDLDDDEGSIQFGI